jgi:phosphoribosylformylglycinamidine cyclo-ligase
VKEDLSYEKAGVSIDAADAAKKRMAESLAATDPRVLNRLGAFASLFEASFPGCRQPVLVLKMEEPGSKQLLALKHGAVESLARDLIHHLVNDAAVMGARPLAVLDTIVCGKLEKERVVRLVDALARACREQGCTLVGGETSEQPGVLAPGTYVLSAALVGVVDREAVIDGSRIALGDAVLGVASNGLHTNGYTLVRRLLEDDPALAGRMVGAESFLEAVLRPHTAYLRGLERLFPHPWLHGLAHITGGGIEGNLDRILPAGAGASIDRAALRVHPVFRAIREAGNVPEADMLRTFNMGVGLVAVVAPGAAEEARRLLAEAGHEVYPIGKIVPGGGKVEYHGDLRWPATGG